MKILFILISLFLYQNHKIVVLDANSNRAIEAASIKFYKDGINFKSGFTDEEGSYYFDFSYDSIVVHSLGFNEKTYLKNNNQNIVIKLFGTRIAIDEVDIKSLNKKSIIGEYKSKSSQTRVIGKEEQFGVLFKNDQNQQFRIKSLLLNIKNIPYKSDIIFKFYKIATIQKRYISYSKKPIEKVLTEIIPDGKNLIDSLVFRSDVVFNTKIIEVNLDSLHLNVPDGGIFISLYTKNIYTANGLKTAISSVRQLPEIYKHNTKEDNYCVLIKSDEPSWQNYNLVAKYGEETDDVHPVFPMTYYEPSMAIKVEEVRQ